jgi:hypothetical protein
MGFVVPGRCPGLSHYAPLGRNTGAALEAINGAIVITVWRRVATLVVIERQFRVVVFNPNGVTGDSPGQRPGFGIKLESQALKGRNEAMQRVRRDEVGVGHCALSGLGFLMGFVVPGRCPGLSHYAPLGRKTNAALKAINGAIVITVWRSVATFGRNRRATPCGGLQPQRGVR